MPDQVYECDTTGRSMIRPQMCVENTLKRLSDNQADITVQAAKPDRLLVCFYTVCSKNDIYIE